MQAITTLLVTLSCGKHFEKFQVNSVACSRKLIHWLRGMSITNDVAHRAYMVLYSIVKTSDSSAFADFVDMFTDDLASQAIPPHTPVTANQAYVSWMGEGQPSQLPLGQQSSEFVFYQLRQV
jgi:hypothetical protein